ncbi:hypothetical protein VTI74DRAFT_1597 [Chaetomium olivicolor]
MDTDKQEEVESPLIEDFLDCDQLGSDADVDGSISASSRRTLRRLHIDVGMTSAQYLPPVAHHSEGAPTHGLPICSSDPQTIAFSSQDIGPYSAVSAVSSFNYPAAPDPNLLTPVSSAGSPPLQQRQSTKPLRAYHPSQSSAPGSQAPTPPSTSAMFYNDYNPNTQSPSPLTVNPAATTEAGPFGMANYVAQSPPGGHHPSSPKPEIQPPIDPYLGHFTVSGSNEEVTHHNHSLNYPPYPVPVAPSGQYMDADLHHRIPSNGQPPILSAPHSSHFRPHQPAGAIEDLRGDPAVMNLNPYQPRASLSPGRRPPPRKKSASSRKQSRTHKVTSHTGSVVNGQFGQDEEEEELTLRSDAPEDDRFLFQLRKQFLSEKGKGMWEEMKAKYSERHNGGQWEKAALQMKVSRAVAKYGEWPEKEKERLREAFQYYEDKRYQLIIARMKENGGCKVWDWKPQHIETMLVKMGLEEEKLDEKTGTRRRRKVARRHASPQNGGHPAMGDWPNGPGVNHPTFHGHAQHVAAQAAHMMGDDFAAPPNLTPSREDALIDQIFSRTNPERSLSPDGSMESLSYDAGSNSRRPSTVTHDLNHQGSERVARQACSQILQPNSQVPGSPYGMQ